ncbi:Reverse transcriptase (RNA-dependent DNA polymerase) [Phytophthora infestans]|uniref:Reverse transcriptase (RNA-dependent DNA polymerase) n=1 Tax=Phytophthora infestans TaxID=4787 RepID=A0A833TE01_PHYIN|nr:Reverse transcriptase (RNA-dependent DNA polymerase) [Phytophthora infestans]
MYWIRIEDRLVLLPIYVDDILLVGKEEDVDFVDAELTKRFKLKCLGDVNYLLGLQIHYDPETHVLFRQTKYIQDIMAKFNMESAYPDMGLQFDFKEARQFDKLKIEVYTDANFASEGGDMKSVTGFTVFCNGQLISAKCWKQNTLAESTCEAELIAANTGIHEAIWLEQLVDELGLKRETTALYCDSSSARELMKHAGKHRRTKQLNRSDLKIREYVKKRGVKLEPVASKENVADIMTKPLPQEAFQGHRDTMGVSTAGVRADESHAFIEPLTSEEKNVRDQNDSEADEPMTKNVNEKQKGRRGIPVRFEKRARAKCWPKRL